MKKLTGRTNASNFFNNLDYAERFTSTLQTQNVYILALKSRILLSAKNATVAGNRVFVVVGAIPRGSAYLDKDTRQAVGNLLARIHRDGGHYVAEHGLLKASEDAETIVVDLQAQKPNEESKK